MRDGTRGEQISAGITTIALTFLCLLLHVPIVYVAITKNTFKTSFFRICAARSLGHIIASVTVGVSCAVSLLCNMEFLPYFINGYYFVLSFLFMSELAIAVNRFIAVYFYSYSSTVFNPRNTKVVILVLIIVSIGRAVVSVLDGCYAIFDYKIISMIFELDDCNGEVALLAVMEVLMFMGFGLNLITFYKLISLTRKGVGQDVIAKQRLRQNVTHFTFTFAQSIIWMVVGVTIIPRSDWFTNYNYVHFLFEDLVEFFGSIGEGLLFWWLNGKHLISHTVSSSGGTGNISAAKVPVARSAELKHNRL